MAPKRLTAGGSIRYAQESDIAAMMTLDRHAPGRTWTREEFLRLMRSRNCLAIVLEQGGLAGYLFYRLEDHALDIRGVMFLDASAGLLMLRDLKRRLHGSQRRRLTINVPESAIGFQLCLAGEGFRATTILRDAFPRSDGAVEDCYRFEYVAPDAPLNRLAKWPFTG